jgi:hypothetical protein
MALVIVLDYVVVPLLGGLWQQRPKKHAWDGSFEIALGE